MGDIQAGQRRELRTPVRSTHLSLLPCVQVRSGAYPASKVVWKRRFARGHEGNHSPPSSDQLKNECSYAGTTLRYFIIIIITKDWTL